MGLDIDVLVNNYDQVFPESFDLPVNRDYNAYHLSRSFCYLILNSVRGDGQELRQLELISGLDLSCLYQMGDAPYDDYHLDITLKSIKSDAEKEKFLHEEETKRTALKGNIDKVFETIQKLISVLNSVQNLPKLMPPHPRIVEEYYADFSLGEDEEYYRYHYFGKDLRNFEKFLIYAKSKETTTVWFEFS